MDKLCLDIIVPNINRRYEFIVPQDMKVGEAVDLIAKTIREHEQKIHFNIEELMMFSRQDSIALNIEYSFRELGISDGSEIILC